MAVQHLERRMMGDDVLPVVPLLRERVATEFELFEIHEGCRQLLRDDFEVGEAVVSEKEHFKVREAGEVTAFERCESVSRQEQPLQTQTSCRHGQMVLVRSGGDASEFCQIVVVQPELFNIDEQQEIGMQRGAEVAAGEMEVRDVASVAFVAFENGKGIS